MIVIELVGEGRNGIPTYKFMALFELAQDRSGEEGVP